ncbi:hypothetical protein L1887_38658 [Cichorium endivia]|nr:hypothetical protein L1887_38658 [Cichorium endivia]
MGVLYPLMSLPKSLGDRKKNGVSKRLFLCPRMISVIRSPPHSVVLASAGPMLSKQAFSHFQLKEYKRKVIQ